MPICSSPYIVEYVSKALLTSTSKYELAPEFRQLLLKNNLLHHVKYLLMENVHAKVELYVLCSKDIIKTPSEDSSNFYFWNKHTCLWKEKDKRKLESYLRNIIHNIYMTIYSLIDKLPRNIPVKVVHLSKLVPIKAGKILLSSIEDLCDCLLNIKNGCIMQSKLREIGQMYIEQMIDENIEKLMNPRGYIAVQDNKIVNLKTGEIKQRTYQDYFTQEIKVKYNPNAVSPLWNKYLDEITLSKQDKIKFLQEFFGYCLTGDCRQGKLLMMIGESKAGKSILLSVLGLIFGKFSASLDNSIIVDGGKSSNNPDPFLADLKNKRLGIMNELKHNDIINTRKFKVLVTNEKLAYRNLYSPTIEHTTSQHVLILASNHKPTFPETDRSIWERLVLVEFKASFVDDPKLEGEFKIDRGLISKLELELEAILRWLVDGAISYYRNDGLTIPKSSLRYLEKYKAISQDENEAYFYERLEKTSSDKDRIKTVDLYDDYKNWCIDHCVRKLLSKVPFEEFLERKGIHWKKSGTNYYTHVKLKKDNEDAVYG